jgi:hypothetical protein
VDTPPVTAAVAPQFNAPSPASAAPHANVQAEQSQVPPNMSGWVDHQPATASSSSMISPPASNPQANMAKSQRSSIPVFPDPRVLSGNPTRQVAPRPRPAVLGDKTNLLSVARPSGCSDQYRGTMVKSSRPKPSRRHDGPTGFRSPQGPVAAQASSQNAIPPPAPEVTHFHHDVIPVDPALTQAAILPAPARAPHQPTAANTVQDSDLEATQGGFEQQQMQEVLDPRQPLF